MNETRESQLQSLSIDRNQDTGAQGAGLWSIIAVAVVCVLISGGGVFFWMNGKVAAEKAKTLAAEEAAADLQISPVAGTNVGNAGMIASGYAIAREHATVSAEVMGIVREVLVDEGTHVKKGQVLARLDDTRAQIGLAQARASAIAAHRNVDSLSAQLTEAKTVLSRATELARRKVGAKSAMTAAQAQMDSLAAQLAAARANAVAADEQVKSQKDLVERYVIRAPFAGVVIAKNAQVGELLAPSAAGGGFTRTGIATIVNMKSLEVVVDVNENQISKVHAGQKAVTVLDAYPDWKIPSKVIAIIPTANSARATIQVRVGFDKLDPRILPNMAAKVTFEE